MKGAAAGARVRGIDVRILNASTDHDLDEAFASLGKLGAGGLVVPNEPFFDSQRDKIVALSARYAVPAVYSIREYVVAGGLLSYGTSLSDSYHRAAVYLGRVLKGEKPANLPIQTAKTLGLTVPPSLLATADEVIE